MPVSRSTIAFAVVACVPFGLAIRDTIGDGPRGAERSAYEAELELAAQRRDMVRAEVEEETRATAEQEEQRTRRKRVFGPGPTTLGSALGYPFLGVANAEDVRQRVSALDVSLHIEVLGEPELRTLVIQPEPPLACTVFEPELRERWGDGGDFDGARSWSDPKLLQRATLTSPGCVLRIEKYVPLEAWIDRSSKDSIVPLWAVGRSVAELTQQLEQRGVADVDTQLADEVTWSDTGLGAFGWGRTALVAHVAKGRVVGIGATAEVRRVEGQVVVEGLEDRFGKARRHGATLHWDKPRMTVEVDGARLSVTAGTVPE